VRRWPVSEFLRLAIQDFARRSVARLLFVDDHPLYRSGVELTLARTMPDLDVTLASSAEEALARLAEDSNVDLCLADYRLPGQDGLSLLAEVGRQWPTIARGLLCSDPTADLARRAQALGCVACLSKARDMDALLEALANLFHGGAIFDGDGQPSSQLSDKRRQVLELAAGGKSNKAIARELGVTERTVKDHWARIFERLAVANRAEAISRAHQLRLL
jgi:DNA-binding NarL/FixJ family response regulator